MDNERLAYRRRRRRKRKLQRLIPAAVAIVLIAVIAFVGWKTGLFESFSYSTEEADLFSYFGAIGDDYAVIVEDGEPTTTQLRVIDGVMYQDLTSIKRDYNDRFYWDVNDNALLYTTAEEVIKARLDTKGYITESGIVTTPYTVCMEEKGDLYVALDYVQLYAEVAYDLYGGNGEPYRAVIRTEGSTRKEAAVTKEQAVRVDMDKKSKIVAQMQEGDQLVVLEEGDEWTKVMTPDLIMGYYETRFLDEPVDVNVPGPEQHTEPAFTYLTKDTPIRLIWDLVTNVDANKGLKERLAGQEGLTTVSPTWFFLKDNDGNMESIASLDYVESAHNMGLEVWGLVENITYNADLKMFDILSYSSKRAFIIEQLMQYAAEYQLDGINLDFETVPEEAGESYAQFVRELSLACRQAGLILSIDNYVPSASTEHYNRAQQGLFADYIIIMGYDEHYNGSEESGSVASINFVIDGITNTLADVPAERVINAVPFYTRIWIETPKSQTEIAQEDATDEYIPYTLEVRTLGMTDAKEAVANAGTETRWDEETAQNYAEWQKGDRKYKVWLEDKASLEAKVQAMHTYHLAGIAAWQLSYATPEAWAAIALF